MAIVKSYKVTYEIANARTTGGPGAKYVYRKGLQQANVAAANIGAIPGVLAGDLSLASGEAIEIIDAHEEPSQGGLFT